MVSTARASPRASKTTEKNTHATASIRDCTAADARVPSGNNAAAIPESSAPKKIARASAGGLMRSAGRSFARERPAKRLPSVQRSASNSEQQKKITSLAAHSALPPKKNHHALIATW